MRILATDVDENGRSTIGSLEVPFTKVGDTESITARQAALNARVVFPDVAGDSWSHFDPLQNCEVGQMYSGGAPRMLVWLSGHNEITMQDGEVFRLAAGDMVFVRPAALHYSNPVRMATTAVLVLELAEADVDTGPFVFRK